jgi:hypothetical protein
MRSTGKSKLHLKIFSSARKVESRYISRRECEVNSSEGVGSFTCADISYHSRTGHFGEHGRYAVRMEELESYDSVFVTILTFTTSHYSPIPYYATSREVHCWDNDLLVTSE